MDRFTAQFPRSSALGLTVIDAGPGFDELDVEAKLGPERFQALMSGVKEVFCCGHATYGEGAVAPNQDEAATTHRLKGYEVHCIYARDLERFLEQEGK